MNCPNCGKSIGGYVTLNSEAYNRVKQGCCPHCGCPMPAGYSVGFPKYKPKHTEYLSENEFDKSEANANNWRFLSYCVSILGGILLAKLIGKGSFTIIGIVAGSLYFIILSVIALAYYDHSVARTRFIVNKQYTGDDIRSGVYAIIICIISVILLIVTLINSSVHLGEAIAFVIPSFFGGLALENLTEYFFNKL